MNNKVSLNFARLTAVTFIITLCFSCVSTDSSKGGSSQNDPPASGDKDCVLTSISVEKDGEIEIQNLSYKNDTLIEVLSKESGYKSVFNYNSNGSLGNINSGRINMLYSYDSLNRLISVVGQDDTVDVVRYPMTYNANNQIEELSFYSIEYLQWKKKYEYNSQGLITKISSYNDEGELYTVSVIKYDGKKNPFNKSGLKRSLFSSILGFASLQLTQNIVSIHKTYKMDAKYPINGKQWKANETKVSTFKYSYNKTGYPSAIYYNSGTSLSFTRLKYDCK